MTIFKSIFSARFILKLCALFVVCLAATAYYIWHHIHATQSITNQTVLITKGASSAAIASRLYQSQVIDSAFMFRWWTRFSGDASALKPGLYHFQGNLSMLDVLQTLKTGDIQQFKVTIPEGLRTDEMLDLLAKRTNTTPEVWQQAMQEVVKDGHFEGVFLPETYLYSKPIQPATLLQQMFKARARVEQALAQDLHWSAEQILRNRIMASIVEKETALAHERVWVSAAIHNRIRLHMPLQMDPTVIYGMYRSQGSFSGNIRRKDLRTDTPWNTYTRQGLPKTPICNPGAASLQAAAYPADVDYLYFVADGTGGHAFAATLAQHNANVRQWIKIERRNHRK